MTDTPTTTDPPTLADELRCDAGMLAEQNDRSHVVTRLRAAADVLDALPPRTLATAIEKAELDASGKVPAPWTVEMDPIGDVWVRGTRPWHATITTSRDGGYYFAGDLYPTLADAVAAAIAHLGGTS